MPRSAAAHLERMRSVGAVGRIRVKGLRGLRRQRDHPGHLASNPLRRDLPLDDAVDDERVRGREALDDREWSGWIVVIQVVASNIELHSAITANPAREPLIDDEIRLP